MMRFSERTNQGLFSSTVTGTRTSDRLPTARHMKVRIDHMTAAAAHSDVSQASGVSSAQVDAIEGADHSKLHNCP